MTSKAVFLKSNDFYHRLAFGCIFVVGVILRLFHLDLDQFFFIDEGAYLGEAEFFRGTLWGRPLFMAKPFYSLLLSFGLTLGGGKVLASAVLQGILSTLWIPLVYLLTVRIFQIQWVGLLASLIVSIDPWIYLYSRHLFPDTLSTALWMVSILFLLSEKRGEKVLSLSGLFFGLAFIANYRMLMFLPGMFGFLFLSSEGKWEERLKKIVVWLGVAFIPLILAHLLYTLFFYAPHHKSNYLPQLLSLIGFHSSFGFRFDSWLTYPTLVQTYEGWLFACLLCLGMAGLLFGKQASKEGKKIFLCLYLATVFIFAFSYFPYARTWAPLLYWHGILGAVGIYSLSQILARTLRLPPIVSVALLSLGLIVGFVPKVNTLRKIRVPNQEALRWILAREKTPLLMASNNVPLLRHLLNEQTPQWTLVSLDTKDNEPDQWLQTRKEGLRYLLLDPHQYTARASSLSLEKQKVVLETTSHCSPVLTLACPHPKEFWTIFAWETNVRYSETMKFINQVDTSNPFCLELFDLNQCPSGSE